MGNKGLTLIELFILAFCFCVVVAVGIKEVW